MRKKKKEEKKKTAIMCLFSVIFCGVWVVLYERPCGLEYMPLQPVSWTVDVTVEYVGVNPNLTSWPHYYVWVNEEE